MAQEYNANSFEVLKELDPVKRRPGMYIGSTDGAGVTHCFFEVVDNATDEALINMCNEISIIIKDDGFVEVIDNGRGIPVDINDETGICGATLVYSKLHAGGKFSNKNYRFSGGLHGVGGAVVNALSTDLILTIKRDGKIHQITFYNGGHFDSAVAKVIGECDPKDTGTSVRYKLSKQYFAAAISENQFELSEAWLVNMLKDRACLKAGLRYNLDYKGNKHTFISEKGIIDLLEIPEYGDKADPIMREPLCVKEETTYKGSRDKYFDDGTQAFRDVEKTDPETGTKVKSKVAVKETYTEDVEVEFAVFIEDKMSQMSAKSYVNNITTPLHGKHLDGLVEGFCQAVKDYLFARLPKKIPSSQLLDSDISSGCQFAIMAMMQDISFKGQTKDELNSQKARTVIYPISLQYFKRWLEMNPSAAERIVMKSIRCQEQRLHNQKAKDEEEKNISSSTSMSLTGILTPCRSRDINVNELFIVEGDSAGGTARKAADKETQAVLPLKGKILNTFKATPTKIAQSAQIKILTAAIGTGVGDEFDYSKLKYGKIIPLTDADVDGSHIQLLTVAYLYKFAVKLIKAGHIFIAVPPLHKLTRTNSSKREVVFIKNDEEFARLYPKGCPQGWTKGRFKGLGEMNDYELEETAMNVKTRSIYQLNYKPEKEAMYVELFDILMGDDPSKRLDFIRENIDFTDL
ncbi:toprim domain-containing protein [Photobacterium kishitanii]|uniref:DNA gyrase subunit B n=1 Tax=Photobacterium kishitanii TaxID=318456 RepID=A0A2T3KMZ8_9GAMM|nr:toprim domain-containing protein [Photobacterium kishitanii]PSV01152.1 hypothetical protein C9J27_03775 [Photobacterium kishitanii]